jgi:DNA helicase-2/ATP-dependent DNA helicase PcrA
VNYLAGLNVEQQSAVTAPIGPILLKAGAGSGKTRVLTLRIAHMVQQHRIDPSTILALTFTNKAAKEMRSRLRSVLGTQVKQLTTGTFHSICVQILRAHIEGKIGHYTRNFSIYSGDEQEQLAQQSIDAAPEPSPEATEVDDLMRRISRAKSRLQTPRMLLAQAENANDSWVALRYRHYQGLLAEANALDFDDLIQITYRLLSEHEDILDAVQKRWKHLLVDEYQDTDPSQFSLIRVLSEPVGSRPRSLFVVGDAMQSIYGFRNADHTIISRYGETFPSATIIELKTNYRSRQAILDAAYAVIRPSRLVLPMQLKAHQRSYEGERSVVFLEYQNGKEEADKIAYEIAAMVHAGSPNGGAFGDVAVAGRQARDFAILYRSKHMSRQFEEALRMHKLPYKLKGQQGFYDRAVIRDLLAYVRLAVNSRDNMALTRIADTPKRGLSAKPLKIFSVEAARRNLAIADVLADVMILAQLDEKARSGARALGTILGRLRSHLKRHSPPREVIEDVIYQTNYHTYLEAQHAKDPEKHEDAKAHINELLMVADEHDDIEAFMQYIAIMTNTDDGDEERDQVQLMTIHAAKGLEWPFVFVCGLEEGVLPHERSMATAEGIEEERRLCYVAVTRAAERLYVSWCRERSASNRGKKSSVSSSKAAKRSRFYDDIEAYGRELASRRTS